MTYDICAAIVFENIRSECESTVRDAALRLRNPQLRVAPKNARWVLLSKSKERKATQAVEEISEWLGRIDAALEQKNQQPLAQAREHTALMDLSITEF